MRIASKASLFFTALITWAVFPVSCRYPEKGGPDAGVAPTHDSTDPETFRAVVLGDRTGGANDSLFEEALTAAARLDPDLIISVGDLIEGYQQDGEMEAASTEWDDVLARIERKLSGVPLAVAAGNHDIWSDESEELFEKRIGQGANASFDIGQARLILFDTSRVESEVDIPDDRLDWLVRELATAQKSAVRVVVTHRPLWAIEPGGRPGTPLHDVLIAGRADLVISGHWHHAMADIRDDIRYQVIGTSGGRPNRPGHPETGNFHQIGLLEIDGGNAHLSLIPTEGALRADRYMYEDNQLEWKIVHNAVRVERFEMDPIRPNLSGSFALAVKNVTPDPMKERLSIEIGPSGWRISPAIADIELEPEESTRLRFRYTRRPGSAVFPGPTASLLFPFSGSRKYHLERRIEPTSIRRVGRVRAAPVMDGRLDDAVWIKAADLGQLTAIEDPGRTAVDTTSKAAVDKEALYLGIAIEYDGTRTGTGDSKPPGTRVAGGDYIEAFVDADLDDSTYAVFAVNASGQSLVKLVTPFGRPPDDNDITWDGSKSAAVSLRENGWSAELRIPLDQLAIKPKTKQKRIGFNLKLVVTTGGSPAVYEWQPSVEKNEPSFGAIDMYGN